MNGTELENQSRGKRSGLVVFILVLVLMLLGGTGFLFYWFHVGEPAKGYYEAAMQGDPEAQYKLAECYYNGNGVRKDLSEAIKWYRKSAEQGCAEGQCALGWHYEQGEGVL